MTMTKFEQDYARMYVALQRIKRYQSPARLRRDSQKQYGLSYEEALEYAYENIQSEAATGLKGVRKPQIEEPK